jgi:uncharacterized protein YdhG (YjbR/CyaY superfamily)
MANSTEAAATTAKRDEEPDDFTAEERAAMKERAKELKAASRRKSAGAKADPEADLLEKIAEMPEPDRVMAERIHAAIKANVPELAPKTWYGMPAYANAEGKVVVFFQESGKFKYRYSTLGFQDAANLDDGDLWPTSYALMRWSPEVEKKVVDLVQAAIS